jgi:hypothetical protein
MAQRDDPSARAFRRLALPEFKYLTASAINVLLLLLCFATAFAQNNPPTNSTVTTLTVSSPSETPASPEKFLPDNFGEKWRAVGAIKTAAAESLGKTPHAEAMLEYGLQKIAARTYSNGQKKYTVEILGARFHPGAYGIHTFIQHQAAGPIFSHQAGRYVARVIETDPDAELTSAIKNAFAEVTSRLPALPEHLPAVESLNKSALYLYGPKALAESSAFGFLKQTLSFAGGTEVAIAEYPNGNDKMHLLLAEFQTPQLATDGLAALQTQYESAPDKEKMLVKRIGNYVAVAKNIQDRPAAESLVKQIKYEMKVYWEGKKFSDIPLEYRPADSTAFAEAAQTAQVLLRAFYWIGIMLVSTIALGIMTGSGFFYWRRYQRRKLGQDDLFSDAGGNVQLNLEAYMLEFEKQRKRLTGKKVE